MQHNNHPILIPGIEAQALCLQTQHRLFSRAIGTLIPSSVSPAEIETALDLICGPGAWVIDLAKTYPHLHVIGLDLNPEMVHVARQNAWVAKACNASFQVGDLLDLNSYPAGPFDFIRIHMGSWLIAPKDWPSFLHSLFPLVRPGGWINLIEFDPGPTSSPALDRLIVLLSQALTRIGHEVSPDWQALTPSVLFPRFFNQVGYNAVDYETYPMDLNGLQNPTGLAAVMTMFADDNWLGPFLAQSGVLTPQEVITLLHTIRQETRQIDFCGSVLIISALGQRPEES